MGTPDVKVINRTDLLARIRAYVATEADELAAQKRSLATALAGKDGWRAVAGYGLAIAHAEGRSNVADHVLWTVEKGFLAQGRTLRAALEHVGQMAAHEVDTRIRSGIPVHCSCPLTSTLETEHRVAMLRAWREVSTMAAKHLAQTIADDTAPAAAAPQKS